MVLNNVLETSEMIEVARTLTPVERQILQSLYEKGPGALLEIAVRVLKFPNDVREPLANLTAKELVTTMELSSSGSGGALISLTRRGEQLARLLQDKGFVEQLTEPTVSSRNAHQQQAGLLEKLGDAAMVQGDVEKASEYYKQALSIVNPAAP